LISLDRLKLLRESKSNDRKHKLLKFIENPDQIFGTTLIGTNISVVVMTTIFTIFFVQYFEFDWLPLDKGFGTLLLTALILIFGEIIPKAIYRDHADHMVEESFTAVRFFNFLFKPAIIMVTLINNFLAKALNIKKIILTREDLSYLLSHTKDDNVFQKEMLEEALEFSELVARNVMIPRTEIVGISDDLTFDEILATARDQGFTRYPVYHEKLDDIVGILIIYDLLQVNKEEFEMKKILREPFFAPETMSIDSVLREMQINKKSMAIVVDAYGGTSGLITIEDIIEEIVGDIEDEFDTDEQIREIMKLADDSYIVLGSTGIDTLNDEYSMNLPEGNYETMAGMILSKLAKIPKEGSKLKIGEWELTILSATSRQIQKIKMRALNKN